MRVLKYIDQIFQKSTANQIQEYSQKLYEENAISLCEFYQLKLLGFLYIKQYDILNKTLEKYINSCQKTEDLHLVGEKLLNEGKFFQAQFFYELAFLYEKATKNYWASDIIIPILAYLKCKLKLFDDAQKVIAEEETLSMEEPTMFFLHDKFSYITKKDIYNAINNKNDYFPRVNEN